jgi:DNA-binding transcriptional ArsR family regulator
MMPEPVPLAQTDAAPGDLWRALASPWRRELLDLLRDQPRTTSDLAAALPALSRFAVMQHLTVLTDAGVVLVRRRGRYRLNYLNPVPLRRFYERWVHPLADTTAGDLLSLERVVAAGRVAPASDDVSGKGTTTVTTLTEQVRVVRLACEMRFHTTPERLFAVMTQDTRSWFPHTYGDERVDRIVFEPRVGGAHYEDWGDGAGHLYGQVIAYDPPLRWATRGRVMSGTILDTEYEIEPIGGDAVLKIAKVAVGPMTEEEAASIATYGDVSRFEGAIRAVVE